MGGQLWLEHMEAFREGSSKTKKVNSFGWKWKGTLDSFAKEVKERTIFGESI